MTTNTTPTDFDPNRHYLTECWPAARILLVDPMDDDAPDDARRAAVAIAVQARKTNNHLPAEDGTYLATDVDRLADER